LLKENLQSRLESFILLENKIRLLFKQKLEMVNETEYIARMEKASALWREDNEVISILQELKKVADDINLHFLEYNLDDILRLWFFFVGLHEEYFFHLDGSHSLFDLIQKPAGYSFNSTMSFVCNRFLEAMQGKEVYANNDRIEMALAYLLIFLSRMLYSPYINKEVKNLELFNKPLKNPIKKLINNKLSLTKITHVKINLNRVLNDFKGHIISSSLTKSQWQELVSCALQNLINLLSIGDYLKNEIYDADWKLLRPALFERSKEGWTTKIFMCVRYEGQISNPEFPFQSIKPKKFVMYA